MKSKKKIKVKKLKKVKKVVKTRRKVLIKKKPKKLKKKRKISVRFKLKKIVKPKKKLSKKVLKKTKKRKVSKSKPVFKKKAIVKKRKKSSVKKIKVLKSRVRKHSVKRMPNDSFSAESFFKAKIKVIGIGGGGGSIVSEIGKSLGKATFVVADTDVRVFKKKKGIKYFLFGKDETHGLGTGLNPALAKEAAERDEKRISSLFEGQDIVIFIASLGGGVGSGATQVFLEASKKFGGVSFGIFTLPFKFEGKNKYKIAYKSLKELRKSLNISITIPNERIFKVIGVDTPITEAFSTVNKSLIQSLESLIDLIYSPGIINIDFADVKAILKGKGNLGFLNITEARGKDRAQTIAKEIFHNPLYQNNNFTAEKILFNIEGSANVSMFEVDKISKSIAQTNPKAKIIFGISKNPKYKNSIKVTLLMTGPGIALSKEAPKEKIILEKKSVKQKIQKKSGKVKKDAARQADKNKEETPFAIPMPPVFDNIPVSVGDSGKLSIVEEPKNPQKAIRRNALEIKEAEELEENKKSKQEKEWEIPAFLRRINRIK